MGRSFKVEAKADFQVVATAASGVDGGGVGLGGGGGGCEWKQLRSTGSDR